MFLLNLTSSTLLVCEFFKDLYREKMEAVEAVRRRQQQRYEADAIIAEEKRVFQIL